METKRSRKLTAKGLEFADQQIDSDLRRAKRQKGDRADSTDAEEEAGEEEEEEEDGEGENSDYWGPLPQNPLEEEEIHSSREESVASSDSSIIIDDPVPVTKGRAQRKLRTDKEELG